MDDDRVTRRRVLALSSGAFAAGHAGCLEGDDEPGDDSGGETTDSPTPTPPERNLPDAVGFDTVVDDLEAPVDIAFLPDGDLRYVASKGGRILVLDGDEVRDEPLLDIGDRVEWGYEMGLLGIALHPEFGDNRRLFVRYSGALRDDAPQDYSHTFVLAEFAVDQSGTSADPESERSVLEIHEPSGNHNSGAVAFGPDGHLYVGTGDGGDANDTGLGHVDDWDDRNEGGNGQDTESNLLGGILRIDVDDEDGGRGYAIPDDNPLVDHEGHRDEYYAWGLRNPWGTSFDDGRYFVADVGQERREEVNLVERGGNYGWNVREGSTCFDASDRFNIPDECPDETPADVRGGEPLIDPIVDYPHQAPEDDGLGGAAVVGGHVYRGSAVPDLEGAYVFGDLQPGGRLFLAVPPDDGDAGRRWATAELPLDDDAADALDRILAFGRDEAGEVYVLGGGGVHRIVPAE